MRLRVRSRVLVMLGLSSGAGAWGPAADRACAQVGAPTLVEQTGTMPPSLSESSGVAASRTHSGVIWSHNDSGDGPSLYALDFTGRLLATLRLQGARARDWEDIARGGCPASMAVSGDCLFIGDIGDNAERRGSYQIYIVREPDPSIESNRAGVVRDVRRLVFAYPDGSHNSESLAVTPEGDILVISKVRAGGTHVFRLAAAAVNLAIQRDTRLRATLFDTLSIAPSLFVGHTATGAAVSPSGTRLVVRTYTQLYFYSLHRDGRITPDGAPCMVGGLALVGEGVDFVDEDMVVLTSESFADRPGEIHRVRC